MNSELQLAYNPVLNSVKILRNEEIVNTIIAILFFILFLIFPIFGFDRSNNFLFATITVIIFSLVSDRLLLKLFILLLPIPITTTILSMNVNLSDVFCVLFLFKLLIKNENIFLHKRVIFFKELIFYYLFYFIWLFNGMGINTGTVLFLTRFSIEPLILFFVFLQLIKSKEDVFLYIMLIAIGTFLSSVLAIYQFTNIMDVIQWEKIYKSMVEYGFYPFFDARYRNMLNIYYRRPGGFFQYGAELACFIPVIYWLMNYYFKFSDQKILKNKIIPLYLIIISFAIITTSSRGMVFAWLISVIAYAMFLSKTTKPFIFILIGGCFLLVAVSLLPSYMEANYFLKTRFSTVYSRMEAEKKAISEIIKFPTILTGTSHPDHGYSHNKFISEWHTKGIFGFIIYILLQLKIIKYALYDKRKKLLLIPIIIFWFITSLTTATPYGMYHTHFLFPLVLAMSLVI